MSEIATVSPTRIKSRSSTSAQSICFVSMLAKLLKFYHIRWEYEPKTFPITWDESGNVVESFTPDFYLPDLNLYIELTTMKQGLVTKKNKKVKLLRTLYPSTPGQTIPSTIGRF